nr:putative phasin family protein [uncultured bacterium]
MAKKTLKKKTTAKQGFAPEVAKDIWLAGLGAFALAQKESGKLMQEGSSKLMQEGSKLFEKLVKEGHVVEGKSRQAAQSAVDDIKGGVEDRVVSIRKQAAENWDKLEKVFEERVARALGRLGVPTADDVQQLANRVEDLANRVVRMTATATTSRKPAAVKPAATKPAAAKKKAAVKKKAVASKAKSVTRELKAKTAK